MEVVKDQSSSVDLNAGKSKLRYPLRSASKLKEEISTSSVSKRSSYRNLQPSTLFQLAFQACPESGQVCKCVYAKGLAQSIRIPPVWILGESKLHSLVSTLWKGCSVPEEGTQSADEDIQSSSATGATKLKPKSLNSESFQASSIFKSAKMDNDQKKVPANKSRGSSIPNATNLKSVSNIDSANTQKKPQRSSRRQEVNKEKAKLKNEGKKSAADKGKTDLADPSSDNKMQQEDKENVVAEQPEEISLAEVR
ncbi:hypothetical protein IFM89_021822 [Coptis chinensis]|uniref:Uncharacterized protein n=1 Tax=Coptis chinensis TaxID=261450 RepID=A0A835I2T5_9MAGN|nr:hypothetical protein IFM89_021822 [Coptis chinensis]